MAHATLTEFLLECFAEDEAEARTAMGGGDGRWASWNRSWDDGQRRDLAADNMRIAALPTSIDEHVCRHSPARVLAECEAKRRIVDLCGDHPGWSNPSPMGDRVLRYLALPYADHPDYREDWHV